MIRRRSLLPLSLAVVSMGLLVGCPAPSVTEEDKEFVYRDDSPLRVTELHFHPTDEQGDAEFIEVTNISTEPFDASGWQVTGAGRLELPAGTRLEPSACAVVCQDMAGFQAAFPDAPRPVAVFDGKLSNGGETVRIEDSQGRVADEVTFDPADVEVGRADGTGYSIHRVARAPTSERGIWQAALPTPSSPRPSPRS